MRHITLLAVLALLCVGAMVFADTATVALTGAVEAGAKIVMTGTSTTIQQYTNNEGTTGWANMDLTASLGDLSANFYLRSSDFATWIIPNAWVTEKLFNKVLELRAGNIDNALSSTANQGWDGISGTGIQIVVNPVAGLSIGAILPAPLVAADLTTTLGGFGIGASYSIPNVANIVATYLNNKEAGFGVNVTAVTGLTAQLEGKFPLTTGATYSIFENVAYKIGSITPGVSATESIGSTFDLTVTPVVTYAMDIYSIWAQVAYTMSSSKIAPEVGVSAAWNGMGTLKVYWDGSFATASSNTIEINFIHNF